MGRTGRHVGWLLASIGTVIAVFEATPPAQVAAAGSCVEGIGRHTNPSAGDPNDLHSVRLCANPGDIVCINPAEPRFSVRWTLDVTTDEVGEDTRVRGGPFDGILLPGPVGAATRTIEYTGEQTTIHARFTWEGKETSYGAVNLSLTVVSNCVLPDTTTTTDTTTTSTHTTIGTTELPTSTQPQTTVADTTSTAVGSTTTQATTDTSVPPRKGSLPNDPTPHRSPGSLPPTGIQRVARTSVLGLTFLAFGAFMVAATRRRPRRQ